MAILLWRSGARPREGAGEAELTRAAGRCRSAARGHDRNAGEWPVAAAAQRQRAARFGFASARRFAGDDQASTTENLQKLNERLAVIDSAQKNITDLATQVTSLQSVLANKQSRGAFGQGRMETIVQDGLPKGAYAFQHTLANKTRPDCCVFMPDQRPLVIDAKFPLEGVTAYRDAKSDDERKTAARAARRCQQARRRHRGEISDPRRDAGHRLHVRAVGVGLCRTARRFRRSGAEGVPRARHHRVAVAAHAGDPGGAADPEGCAHARGGRPDSRRSRTAGRRTSSLLGDRVRKLQTHFNQSNEDIRQAIISIEKIEAHGERIQQVELGAQMAAMPANSNVIPAPSAQARSRGIAAHAR